MTQSILFGLAALDGTPVEPCLHCKERARARKSRGLCATCFGRKEVRHAYPRLCREEPRQQHGEPPERCPHPPGSEARLATLEARAAAGYSLFRADDRRMGDVG